MALGFARSLGEVEHSGSYTLTRPDNGAAQLLSSRDLGGENGGDCSFHGPGAVPTLLAVPPGP